MIAHIGHWTTTAWVVLAGSLTVLATGIAVAFVARRRLAIVATVLTGIGLLGTFGVAAMAGPGMMHGMMGGGGMGSMMQSGDTGSSGPAAVAGAREVRVESKEFSFAPAEIRLRSGETVNIRFDNAGHMFHTLTVGELGLDLRVASGDEVVGSIRGERAGTYTFICTVSGHAAAGMQGKVIVQG